MFDIGFWELVLVGVVALLVFGPERLPRVAREAALWMRKARSMVASVKSEIDQELRLEELKQSLQEGKKRLERDASAFNSDELAKRMMAASRNKSEPEANRAEPSHEKE
ncbi:Sec-independent protein translocase protein TatB [Methylomagnum sp.]